MKKKLHVACGPLTGTIFVGHLDKTKKFWLQGKQDLTDEILLSAAMWLQRNKEFKFEHNCVEFVMRLEACKPTTE